MLDSYQEKFYQLDLDIRAAIEVLEKEGKIHYQETHNNPQNYDHREVQKFHDFEVRFPLDRIVNHSYSGKVCIYHEYYELMTYPEAEGILDEGSRAIWKGDAASRAKQPKGHFIANELIYRLEKIEECFLQGLSSTRSNTSFHFIQEDLQLIQALIDFYSTKLKAGTQIQVFYRDYIKLTKEVTDLYLQGLILILEEKIEQTKLVDTKETTLASDNIPTDEQEETLDANTLKLPKLNKDATILDRTETLLLFHYLKDSKLIKENLYNRHLAYVIHMLTTYSSKVLISSEIKEFKEHWTDIMNADHIDYRDKESFISHLSEVKSAIDMLSMSISEDLKKLKEKTSS